MEFNKILKSMDYKLLWDYLNDMDFESQKKTYYYYQISTVIFSIIFFIIGFIFNAYQVTIIGNLVVMVINIILFVPGWPVWKKKSRKFLSNDISYKKNK